MRNLLCFILFLIVPAALFPQSKSWYKQFTATIDKYPVTFHLHKTGPRYSGFYYYEKKQHPAYISGDDTSGTTGIIRLHAYIPGQTGSFEIFKLTITGDRLKGEWQKDSESKALPVIGKVQVIPGLGFEMVYTEGNSKLKPGLEGSPESTFDAASVWPTGTHRSISFLRKKINGYFGAENSTTPVGNTLLANKKEYQQSFGQDFKEVADSELLAFPSGYSQSETHTVTVVYHSSRLLTLANFYYAFTGGAHGNYNTTYHVFNLANSTQVKLNQVLTTAGLKQAGKLLEKRFRILYGVKPTDPLTEGGLFENKIAPTDNFYLTGKGIGFSYAPYEIGPYAMGEINIFIPFTELKGFLQPAFATLK